MTALVEIEREELAGLIDAGRSPILVDALSALSFAQSRLPGAINIPPEQVDDLARRLIPDRSSQVVVYCMSDDCDASVQTGERLIELGYTNVRHYQEGKRGWAKAGRPLERGPKEARVRRVTSA